MRKVVNDCRITEKRIKFAFILMITAMVLIILPASFLKPQEVKAGGEIIATGQIAAGRTKVNIRTEPNTSCEVITMQDGGFKLDIYGEVSTSDTYFWYDVGFYLDGTYRRGYVSSTYVEIYNDNNYEPDGDFEAYLDDQGFPESYKDGLRELHAQYPEWVFVADYTGKDWDEVVKNQNVLGRSLIYGSAKSSWKSTADGCYNWETGKWYELDSGGWVQASSELIEYALDPRNFFNPTNIFMFEKLAYEASVHNEDGVNNVIDGSFMDGSNHDLTYQGNIYNYTSGLILAGKISGVSPYHLATRIIQEQGRDGHGASISGTESGYYGYYNYYNWGAVKSGSTSAVQNGLKYASKTDAATLRPWKSRMLSIVGGAIKMGEDYINRGQNTLYYEKFDLISPYWHQYMTNVLAPKSESSTAAAAYSEITKRNTAFIFTIPVYENMPSTVCEIPTGDGSPNNTLSELSVDGFTLTPTFDRYTQGYDLIVDYSTSYINVNAVPADSNARITGDGYHNLSVGNNEISVRVTAPNGTYRTYVLNVTRKENTSGGGGDAGGGDGGDDTNPGYSADYRFDSSNGFVSRIGVGSSASSVLGAITFTGGAYGRIYSSDGTQNTGTVATGDELVIYNPDGSTLASYDIVIYGDVNGDGAVTSLDMVYVKRHVLDVRGLSGAYKEAANANRGNDGITSLDMVYIKRHVLDIRYIQQ